MTAVAVKADFCTVSVSAPFSLFITVKPEAPEANNTLIIISSLVPVQHSFICLRIHTFLSSSVVGNNYVHSQREILHFVIHHLTDTVTTYFSYQDLTFNNPIKYNNVNIKPVASDVYDLLVYLHKCTTQNRKIKYFPFVYWCIYLTEGPEYFSNITLFVPFQD